MSDAKPGDSAAAEPKAESRQDSDKQRLVNDRPVDAASDHRQSSTNHGHHQQRAYGQPTASHGGNTAKFAPSSPSGLNPNAPAFKPRPQPPTEQLTFPGGYSDFNPVHATAAGPRAFTFPNGNDVAPAVKRPMNARLPSSGNGNRNHPSGDSRNFKPNQRNVVGGGGDFKRPTKAPPVAPTNKERKNAKGEILGPGDIPISHYQMLRGMYGPPISESLSKNRNHWVDNFFYNETINHMQKFLRIDEATGNASFLSRDASDAALRDIFDIDRDLKVMKHDLAGNQRWLTAALNIADQSSSSDDDEVEDEDEEDDVSVVSNTAVDNEVSALLETTMADEILAITKTVEEELVSTVSKNDNEPSA